jgi:hypothetical protein
LIVLGLIFFKQYHLKRNGSETKSSADKKSEAEAGTKPLFSGTLKRIDRDLGLAAKKEDLPNDYTVDKNLETLYYDAGIFDEGEFRGYTRIIAILPIHQSEYGCQIIKTLATKDYQGYIVNSEPENPKSIPYGLEKDPLFGFDTTKVIKAAKLPSAHPTEIPLNDQFSLNSQGLAFISGKTSDGKYVTDLLTNLDKFTEKQKYGADLRFYVNQTPNTGSDIISKYEDSYTTVITRDSSGLAYIYTMEPKAGVIREIVTDKDIYNTYTQIPYANMRFPEDIVLKNINDDDLEKIGTTKNTGLAIYALKDKNHELLKWAYDDIAPILKAMQEQEIANNRLLYTMPNSINNIPENMRPPTYDNYVSKNPLIFYRDAWGRWNVRREGFYLRYGHGAEGCMLNYVK